MSTGQSRSSLDDALGVLPEDLRRKVVDSYLGVKSAFSRDQHDTTGLRAGRLCEAVLRTLQWKLTGAHIPMSDKIGNFVDECRKLERMPQGAGPESLRVILPRALVFLYTVRNKRGIGHLGGDLEANEIDAVTTSRVADWCICELVRVVYAIPIQEAQAILNAISVRQMPPVWDVHGKKRILRNGLDYKSKTLLLLYSEPENATVPVDELLEWTSYSNPTMYRTTVLRPLHADGLIEYDEQGENVTLSPLGIRKTEEDLLYPLN